MNLGYLSGGPNRYNNVIGAGIGTMVLEDQSDNGRVVTHNPMFSRTIASSVLFGATAPSVDRAALMAAYMDYLLYGLGLETGECVEPNPLSVGPNPVAQGRTARLAVSAGFNLLAVHDVTGRTVAEWHLGGNERAVSWTPDVAPGTYLLSLRGRDVSWSRPLVVAR